MTTSQLLHERMKEKEYSKIRLQNELGCCEKHCEIILMERQLADHI